MRELEVEREREREGARNPDERDEWLGGGGLVTTLGEMDMTFRRGPEGRREEQDHEIEAVQK